MEVSNKVQEAYSNQYTNAMIEWRTTGAKFKAKNIVALSKNITFDSVLEVGCGEGAILDWLSKWNFTQNLNGLEISESGIEIIKSKKIEHLKDIQLFDGYKIPYPDNHFDLVICSHVMEHVEHERILLREIQRVSKYQIFEIPIDFSFSVDKKFEHFMSYGHINIYTPALFRFLLKTENYGILNDICYFYDDEVLKLLYPKNLIGYYKMKTKYFLLKSFSFLKKIKPSSYAVLTTKTEKQHSIFETH